jgi:cell volume regulation protein A
MALDILSLLGVIGVTVLLGYVANIIFERTRIADVLWLLVFGMAVAWSRILPQEPFIALSPVLSTIALLIILFDAGLHLELYQFLRGLGRSFAMGVIGLAFSMAIVAVLGLYVLGFTLEQGLLLGAMLGGTTSAIVVGLSRQLRMGRNTRTLVMLESIVTDPLTIIATLAVIGMLVQQAAAVAPAQTVAAAFSVGIVTGTLLGIVWLWILNKIKGRPYDYILTIGIAFLVYTLTELLGGSGAIAALFFGLALGNGRAISKILKLKKVYMLPPILKRFQGEITFFIRAFFFVLLGLIVRIDATYVIYGLLIALALVLVRIPAVSLATAGMDMHHHDRRLMQVMAPRGLAPAVLSQIAASMGVPGADMLASIIFVVIFATIIYTAVASAIVAKPHKAEKLADNSGKRHGRHR